MRSNPSVSNLFCFICLSIQSSPKAYALLFRLQNNHLSFIYFYLNTQCALVAAKILALEFYRIFVYEKFPFFIAELLEIDKQKPWSRTNVPALVKASMANT